MLFCYGIFGEPLVWDDEVLFKFYCISIHYQRCKKDIDIQDFAETVFNSTGLFLYWFSDVFRGIERNQWYGMG